MDFVKPSTFDGSLESDVVEFFQQFKECAIFNSWSDEQTRHAIPLYLIGNAKIFYRSLSNAIKADMKTIKKEFINHYNSYDKKWQLRQSLYGLKQEEGKLDAYIENILDLTNRLQIPNQTRVDLFIHGLNNNLQYYLWGKRPKTILEAIQIARMKASLQEETGEIKKLDNIAQLIISKENINLMDPTDRKFTYGAYRFNQRNEINEYEKHSSTYNPYNKQTYGVCQLCSKSGHSALSCLEKKRFKNLDIRHESGRTNDDRKINISTHNKQNYVDKQTQSSYTNNYVCLNEDTQARKKDNIIQMGKSDGRINPYDPNISQKSYDISNIKHSNNTNEVISFANSQIALVYDKKKKENTFNNEQTAFENKINAVINSNVTNDIKFEILQTHQKIINDNSSQNNKKNDSHRNTLITLNQNELMKSSEHTTKDRCEIYSESISQNVVKEKNYENNTLQYYGNKVSCLNLRIQIIEMFMILILFFTELMKILKHGKLSFKVYVMNMDIMIKIKYVNNSSFKLMQQNKEIVRKSTRWRTIQ